MKTRDLLKKILDLDSVAIVGMEKNTGKTEVLNFIVKHLGDSSTKIGVTSIGMDGESIDQVTLTPKPEIILREGNFFATSERHFKEKKFFAEIFEVSEIFTPLGRIVLAKALEPGKIILTGPSTTTQVKRVIEDMIKLGATTVLVDGAIFRLSSSSPFITDGVILATGAALSLNKYELLKKTKHKVNLMKLPEVSQELRRKLSSVIEALWLVDDKGELEKIPMKTTLLGIGDLEEDVLKGKRIYVTGSLSEKFVRNIIQRKWKTMPEIIVRDYTKVFVSPETLDRYFRLGGRIFVLKQVNLLAVTVNPLSPKGYKLNSEELVGLLEKELGVPVIDVVEEGDLT
ncbi:MAG: hypothetical protein PWQ27_1054 [Kosmotoga sp.]|nr:hypothetical protein [Kosmotoga sp.]